MSSRIILELWKSMLHFLIDTPRFGFIMFHQPRSMSLHNLTSYTFADLLHGATTAAFAKRLLQSGEPLSSIYVAIATEAVRAYKSTRRAQNAYLCATNLSLL